MTDATKTVLITGATRGIGLAFVSHYVKSGWNVIAAARNPASADKLKAANPYKVVQIDTSDEASILQAAKDLAAEPIDLLINNAGIGEGGGLDAETKQTLMRQFEVNSVAPFLMTRAFLPNLKLAVAKHGSAVVGQVSSVLGSITENKPDTVISMPGGGMYGYRSSKAALNMINASLALDLKADKIVCVSFHPGYVSTDMTKHDPNAISTEQSVGGMTTVLARASAADSGKFFNYGGETLPW